MHPIVAAALAQINAIDLAGTEQFVAGLIFGLVGKNDLSEIQTCLTGAQTLETEITTAITDFQKKDVQDIIAGIEQVGLIINQLPSDLINCKNIQGDLKRIQTWAQIFTKPTTLVETVTKNMLQHYTYVLGDIVRADGEWNNKQYYQVGDDVADILVQTIGAVPAAETLY